MTTNLSSYFWGVPSATVDWCEENYEKVGYAAEFCMYNTERKNERKKKNEREKERERELFLLLLFLLFLFLL